MLRRVRKEANEATNDRYLSFPGIFCKPQQAANAFHLTTANIAVDAKTADCWFPYKIEKFVARD